MRSWEGEKLRSLKADIFSNTNPINLFNPFNSINPKNPINFYPVK